MTENNMLAMCGCRCDLCKAYAPNAQKCDRREVLAQMWNKYYGLDPSVMDKCGGCRNSPSDGGCPVRKCVLEKKLNHCGDCANFPCEVFYQRCGSFPEEAKKGFDMEEYNEYILAYDNETRLREYIAGRDRLKKVSAEAMRFMRGNYALDEAGNGKDELVFSDGGETVLTIRIRGGCYDFAIGENTIQVTDFASLENAKETITAAKKPNRKPFPKENAIYGGCGHRCDLCVHYTGSKFSAEFIEEMRLRVRRVYGMKRDEEFPPCKGCANGGITGKSDCAQMKCAREKGAKRCMDCPEYDCGNASVGWKPAIEPRSISADDVTWAILPYVDGQYGN